VSKGSNIAAELVDADDTPQQPTVTHEYRLPLTTLEHVRAEMARVYRATRFSGLKNGNALVWQLSQLKMVLEAIEARDQVNRIAALEAALDLLARNGFQRPQLNGQAQRLAVSSPAPVRDAPSVGASDE
jgi:hypothetical protein